MVAVVEFRTRPRVAPRFALNGAVLVPVQDDVLMLMNHGPRYVRVFGLREVECLPIPVHVGGVVNLEEARHVPHTSDLVSRRHVASISRCNC
jgi:hypothetical protein